jgi:hypothetical protein
MMLLIAHGPMHELKKLYCPMKFDHNALFSGQPMLIESKSQEMQASMSHFRALKNAEVQGDIAVGMRAQISRPKPPINNRR